MDECRHCAHYYREVDRHGFSFGPFEERIACGREEDQNPDDDPEEFESFPDGCDYYLESRA